MEVATVKDCMTTKLVTLRPDMRIQEAIKLLLKHKISGAPVVSEERTLIGMLSEKDCLRIFANGAYNTLPGAVVEQYMSREVTTINPDADIFTAAEVFLKHPFRRLPIVDEDGRLLGQISRRDVLNGSHKIWSKSPVKKAWTDATYLTDEIKAALTTQPRREST
jgi:CBS domain-containing protein